MLLIRMECLVTGGGLRKGLCPKSSWWGCSEVTAIFEGLSLGLFCNALGSGAPLGKMLVGCGVGGEPMAE